eukprot:Phypoly_transcript_01399.p1 GENE.Phypoly_transcript_01399~~Phypoly_transcript_01399.p1  ORF type:complete len:917 (+),score=105.43 Phypoly_transcript_01399:210-2960(+)
MSTAGLYVCGQCKFQDKASVETFFKPASYILKESHSFSSIAAGKNTCYGVENGILYNWDTSGEVGIHVVQGLDGLKVYRVFTHFEIPYACILTEDGQVYSWGKSDNFLTGLGTEKDVSLPLRMECFDSPVVHLALASEHGIAVTRRGSVYTWGIGQGLGTESLPFPNEKVASEMDFFAMPTKVSGFNTKVNDVAAGDNFSIVCTEGGEVWTWGEGSGGKLGHGDQKDQREPMLVAGLKGKHIIQVAAGEKHSVALSKDGEVYSWGSNTNSELGVEGNPLKCQPGALVNLTNVAQITCVKSSNFAITKDGDLFVWGQNTWGQLGLGHSRNIPIPSKVTFPPDAKISLCSMGFSHALFLTNAPAGTKSPRLTDVGQLYGSPPPQFYTPVEEGQLWCTGAVLGTGNEVGDDMTVFTPAKSFFAMHVVKGSTGTRAGYASTADGLLWTWGKATLGNGPSTDPVPKPTKMWDLEGNKILQVVASPDDWYMALTADGRLYAWGDSGDFKTGLGSETKQVHPRLVEGFDSPVARVAIGQSHGVAVTADYGVFTWGTGKGLGNGGRQNTEKTPKRVIGMEQYSVCDVSAGNMYSALLTKDGKVLSWGEGCSGKLGHGNEDSFLIPTEIAKLRGKKIVQVACGGEFCLALSDKGQVFSWGSGSDGCLGVGSTFLDNMYEPQCIPYLEKICVISAVTVSGFAISTEGALYAWGKPHLGVGSGRVMGRPIRVASLQKVRVQGVAGGEWQTFAWVSSHDLSPPSPPSLWPWPKAPQRTPSSATLANSASTDFSRSPSRNGIKETLTAVDPERFAAHENYLKKLPFMHRFFDKDRDIDTKKKEKEKTMKGERAETKKKKKKKKKNKPGPSNTPCMQRSRTKKSSKVGLCWQSIRKISSTSEFLSSQIRRIIELNMIQKRKKSYTQNAIP